MLEKIALYFSIYITSAVKFIAGPTIGIAAGVDVVSTVVLTVLGMMTTVFLFTVFGPQMRKLLRYLGLRRKRVFSRRSRRFVRIWQKYGIPGTAFLPPLILTPVGGAIIINSFKSPPTKIYLYMGVSAVFWGVVLTNTLKYLKDILIL